MPSLLLFCFAQAFPLRDELRDALPGNATDEAMFSVLRRERNCPDWYRYQPGMSPKEHLEDERMMRIEADRRAHDLRMAEIEREARASAEKIQADSLEIAKAIKASSEATQHFTTNWTYLAFGLAVLIAVIAVLTYFGVKP